MENRIKILDDITINKIAAGEVVERPASIVKELIENSIDAGATRITVEIESGGKSFIKIVDNGSGIPSSEVSKCFLRHATSKIDTVEDLFRLNTLGFRGEALASISAVSKLEMTTKYKDESIGTYIKLDGGKISEKEPVGANTGTIICIRDLFFNTPARKKFLKSDHSETLTISDTVNKMAIGYPDVKFKYINNGKVMLTTPGDGKSINAIRCIYGKDIASNLIHIEYDCNLFRIDGYLGNNNIFRSNRNLQHIYINGRFVKSKVITDALFEAYKAIIPINKHAICFLNLYLDPSKLDVNIHPAKLEVKFEKEREIYFELQDYIRGKLLKSDLISKYEKRPQKSDIYEKTISPKRDVNKIDYEKDLNVSDNNFSKSSISDKKDESVFSEMDVQTFNLSDNISSFKKFDDISDSVHDNQEKYKTNHLDGYNTPIDSTQIEIKNAESGICSDYGIKDNDIETVFSLSDYSICGTVFDTYIILQKGNSMYLMDQHAAHERVLFEKYMNSFKNRKIDVQMLLDPILIELSTVDISVIENKLVVFNSFGFDVEIFGKNHILIRGVPNLFGVPQSEKFILEIIDNIDEISNTYDLKYDRFAIMACKSAIKANYKIKNMEIPALFSQLEKCENPYTCPHGRPIMVEFSKTDIEKMFKRIM